MPQGVKQWLSKHRLIVCITLGFVAAFVLLLFSPDFQQCVQTNQPGKNHQSPKEYFSALFGIRYWCAGLFFKENGEVITALATVIMAAFTGTLWRATTEQGKLTKEALVVVSRAFVFLEDVGIRFSQVISGGGMITDIKDLAVVPKWKNSGDTPTRNLNIRVNSISVLGGLPYDFAYSFTDEPLTAIAGPKANEWSEPIKFADDLATDALRGVSNLYIWGRADYHDVFEGTPPRFTQFCYRLRFIKVSNELTIQVVPYGTYNRTDADRT